MADQSLVFASNFDSRFRSLTAGLSHNENPLFQAMRSALVSLSGKFQVEEYHGSAHQVTFSGNGTYVRASARCELSDLMIIVYSSMAKTWGQVLKYKKKHDIDMSWPDR